MCGIVAAWTPRPLPDARTTAALASIAHRGPDGRGDARLDDGRLWLGHHRLAIISPTDGAQPMTNEDGTVTAVVNGEIYGFESMRRELETRGHSFATGSDSEVLIHLYEERGTAFVEELRGELAFVLYDQKRRRLVAGRDRFGVKPLCFAFHDGGLYLASEAKALFALGVPARWDEQSFLHATAHQYLPPRRSLFAGVSKVPAAHLLIAEADLRPTLHRYWDLDLRRAEDETRVISQKDERAAVASFAEALDEAVALRLRSDARVAFALSGGLDSSAIVALAARHVPEPAETFGISFDHAPYDESQAARDVATHLGARHHVVQVSQDDLVDALPAAVAHGEGLAINGQLPAKLVLSRAIRDAGFSVVLTGEGADELLYGYPHLGADLAATLPDDERRAIDESLATHHRASRGVMLPSGRLAEDDPGLDAVARRLGFVPTFVAAKAAFGRRLGALFSDEGQRRLRAENPLAQLLDAFDHGAQLEGRHPVAQSAYLWTRLALADYILRTLGDGTEMASSIEGRPPFLDHHVFERARALPLSLKLRGGVEKWVLRASMRGRLPESTRKRPKHPFLAPPLALYASKRGRALFEDVLRSRAIDDVPFVERHRVAAFLDRLPHAAEDERAAAEPVLFTLLSASLLAQRFSLGTPTEHP